MSRNRAGFFAQLAEFFLPRVARHQSNKERGAKSRSPRCKQGRINPIWFQQAIDYGRYGRSATVLKHERSERSKRRSKAERENVKKRESLPAITRAKPEHVRAVLNRMDRKARHARITKARLKREQQSGRSVSG